MKSLLLATTLLALPARAPAPARFADDDLVYGGRRSEIFRQHHVRTVLLEQQPLMREVRPGLPHLISRQEVDTQGRVSRQEITENQSYLVQRLDYSYNAAGAQVAQTIFERAESKPDTVRSSPAWLPALHTRTISETDQPAGSTRWNRENGLWEPIDRMWTWTSHDTTYAETRVVADGRRTLLTRTYYTGPDLHTMRFDVLPYTGFGLNEPRYQYYRFERGNPVESGTVSYAKEFAAYRTQHTADRGDDQHARHEALDQLARRSPGTNQPEGTATYAKGQLLTMDMYDVLTTYLRDKQGRALSRRMGPKTQRRGRLTTYTYRPDGLLASETEALEEGPTYEIRRYRYEFY